MATIRAGLVLCFASLISPSFGNASQCSALFSFENAGTIVETLAASVRNWLGRPAEGQSWRQMNVDRSGKQQSRIYWLLEEELAVGTRRDSTTFHFGAMYVDGSVHLGIVRVPRDLRLSFNNGTMTFAFGFADGVTPPKGQTLDTSAIKRHQTEMSRAVPEAVRTLVEILPGLYSSRPGAEVNKVFDFLSKIPEIKVIDIPPERFLMPFVLNPAEPIH